MRKTMLLGGALSLVLGATITVSPLSAQAQMVDGPQVDWKLSVWGKRRAFTEGIEYVSDQLKERTGGKFNLRIYYGDQLSKSKENLDGIKLGAFEAAFFCASYHPGKNKPLNVLDLPFLPLGNFAVMRAAHDAVYNHPDSKKALKAWNAHLYMSNILPQYEYMGKGPVPQSVKDFEGKRLRALGGMGEAARLIGATPSTMPASETYTALQRGTVDAIGFPYSYTFSAYKLDEVADWVTTNMSLGTVNCPTVFNLQAYEKLPDQYKQLLEDLKDGAYAAMEKAYAEKDRINEEKWSKDPDLQMVEIPEKEMEEFRRIAGKPVWDKWIAENKGEFDAQGLFDLVMEAANR